MQQSTVSFAAALAAGAAVFTWPQAVGAREEDRKETVMSRPRPEVDPLGIRLGSFLLYPALTLGIEFDDNIYRNDEDRDADLIGRIVPRARLVSDWNDHALELAGYLDVGEYFWNPSENFVDGAIGAAGRIDLTGATGILAGAQYEALHEDRGSPDARAGTEPTEFQRISANLGVSHRFSRLSVLAEARYVGLDFNDTETAAGVINNDDRDRDIYLFAARAGFEFLPQNEAFARIVYNVRDYDASLDDFGLDRDSEGYEIVVGTQFDLTGITYGEVFVGYREQRYDDRALGTIDGLTFGARLTSNVTQLTTVQLLVDREIEETSIAAAEGYWTTAVRATVDHELLRNLILSGSVGYTWNEYKGIGRDDGTFRVTVGADCLVNRLITVGGSYDFERRKSNGAAAGVDYTSNRVLLKITGHF